jgi:hypothetical protein
VVLNPKGIVYSATLPIRCACGEITEEPKAVSFDRTGLRGEVAAIPGKLIDHAGRQPGYRALPTV